MASRPTDASGGTPQVPCGETLTQGQNVDVGIALQIKSIHCITTLHCVGEIRKEIKPNNPHVQREHAQGTYATSIQRKT